MSCVEKGLSMIRDRVAATKIVADMPIKKVIKAVDAEIIAAINSTSTRHDSWCADGNDGALNVNIGSQIAQDDLSLAPCVGEVRKRLQEQVGRAISVCFARTSELAGPTGIRVVLVESTGESLDERVVAVRAVCKRRDAGEAWLLDLESPTIRGHAPLESSDHFLGFPRGVDSRLQMVVRAIVRAPLPSHDGGAFIVGESSHGDIEHSAAMGRVFKLLSRNGQQDELVALL